MDAAEREKFAAFLLRMRAAGLDRRELVAAVEATPRSAFVPAQWRADAWADRSIPIECGEAIEGIDLQMRVLAALDLGPECRVLEVGTGSGFTAAVMARLSARVLTLDRFRTLTEQADAIVPYLARFQPLRISAAVVPPIILGFVFVFSWVAALALLMAAPVIPIFMALIGWQAKAASERQLTRMGNMNAFLLDRLRGLATIRAFRERHGDIILKPLYGNGGAGVFRLDPNDRNLASLHELFTGLSREPLIVQKFLPAVEAGDKRVILVDGVPVGAINRVPQAGETRSNMHVGGRAEPVGLTERDHEICAAIGPTLRDKGQVFVGIDVIGDSLTEINVTSPTGIQELERFDGTNAAARIWEAIEARRGS